MPQGAPAAVRLRGVRKSFGDHVAVRDLDLDLPRGCICGLLGPNGSGKTTTIRLMLGLVAPDEGRVTLLDGPPDDARRARVGYLPEQRSLYGDMRVRDQLVFFGVLRGLPRAEARRRTDAWLERFELTEWAGEKVEGLSKGMQQKVQVIAAALHEPELLVLDEPFTGLDPLNRRVLEEVLRAHAAAGGTVLLSTHALAEAERLVERVCVLVRSRKVLDGRLRDLQRASHAGVWALSFQGDDAWVRGPEVAAVQVDGDGLRVTLHPGADERALLARAVKAGARLERFQALLPSLHDLVIEAVGGPPDGAGDAPDERVA